METQTSLAISFKQNPAVGEALSGKKIGDACELEVKTTIKELTPDGVVLNIESAIPEGYEEVKETEEDPSGMPPTPVAPSGSVGMSDETIPTGPASLVRKKA